MEIINRDQAEQLMRGTNGQFFSVTFRKRSDNSLRTYSPCRTGPHKKDTNGVGKNFKDSDHGILTVRELTDGKNQFRSVSLERVVALKIAGIEYAVG